MVQQVEIVSCCYRNGYRDCVSGVVTGTDIEIVSVVLLREGISLSTGSV